jgi:hypothetical protein
MEKIRGYNAAQYAHDHYNGPDEYKLDPDQDHHECIVCGQEWNAEDCKEYQEGYVCCDCEYDYISKLVERNAQKLAPEYIASDPEVEKDFYLNWWFGGLDDEVKVMVLKAALFKRKRELMQEYAKEADGFREFVERKEEV